MWDALEADLLAVGLTLDDYPSRLSLRAVRHFMFWADRGSAMYRLEYGEASQWGHVEELLAKVLETLWDANWQRAGNRTAPRPKPLPRPGQARPAGERHFGGEPMSINEFEKRMAERRAA